MGTRRRRTFSDGGPTLISRCTRMLAVGAVALATAVTTAPATAAVDAGPTEIVSRSEQGVPGDGASWNPQVSADGRFVAFTSEATTLVPGDTNGQRDVFVSDLTDGSVERVSVDENGQQLRGHSDAGSVSADGRYVLFDTTELVETADGNRLDRWTYVRDRREATTREVEVRGRDGEPVPAHGGTMSGNGRFYVFVTDVGLVGRDDNNRLDLYRLDLFSGALRLVSTGIPSRAYRESRWPSVSHSGRFVAFEFTAPLVKRDRLRARDIYVRDLRQRRPRLVTLSSDGVQADRGSMAPAISAGGRYVVYSSYASNLVRGDTNDDWDVFWHDRRTGATERMTVNSRGRQGDRQSQGPGFWSESASVSRDGRFVVFGSLAGNLAPETNDAFRNVYVRDRSDGTTTALSLTPAGTGGSGDSGGVRISGDGSTVTFWSEAPDLVVDDLNAAVTDVFVRALGGSS